MLTLKKGKRTDNLRFLELSAWISQCEKVDSRIRQPEGRPLFLWLRPNPLRNVMDRRQHWKMRLPIGKEKDMIQCEKKRCRIRGRRYFLFTACIFSELILLKYIWHCLQRWLTYGAVQVTAGILRTRATACWNGRFHCEKKQDAGECPYSFLTSVFVPPVGRDACIDRQKRSLNQFPSKEASMVNTSAEKHVFCRSCRKAVG
jgi:hypothetical protein